MQGLAESRKEEKVPYDRWVRLADDAGVALRMYGPGSVVLVFRHYYKGEGWRDVGPKTVIP